MYCIFGVTTTIVNWAVYSVYVLVVPIEDYTNGFPTWFQELIVSRLHLDIKLIYAGVIAWIVAVIVAFVTNKLWVFESKSWNAKLVLKEALTFFGGRIATGILEVAAVPAFVAWGFDVTLFGVDGLPAKIVISVAIVILNYILSKFISFRSRLAK
ncbi:MAG: GtrA family protein [Oscillospiraceae bacterium]|nr:GtrA family protein [Oscillospiraceae bacterium]